MEYIFPSEIIREIISYDKILFKKLYLCGNRLLNKKLRVNCYIVAKNNKILEHFKNDKIVYLKSTLFPKEIGNLVNLQELYLNNNQITTIPKEIGNLVNLQEFDLSNNRITDKEEMKKIFGIILII